MNNHENLNTLSSLLTQIAICNASEKSVPVDVYQQLYQLEKQGQDVRVHLKEIQGGVMYAQYWEQTMFLRRGVVSLLDVVKMKNEIIQPVIPTDSSGVGWRRADSFIGRYFMKLNRQLTSDII